MGLFFQNKKEVGNVIYLGDLFVFLVVIIFRAYYFSQSQEKKDTVIIFLLAKVKILSIY